ncbi:transposase [Streptomyces sp. NPDC005533]|uniref:transposase n=1 Tax=Streptomyces sp. NPDC005533 TaxID=3364723 RepID=UPI0036C835B4
MSLIVTPGQRADCTQFIAVLERIRVPRIRPGKPRKKPDNLAPDKAYSNGPCRDYLRRRGIRHTIPEQQRSPQRPRSTGRAARGRPGWARGAREGSFMGRRVTSPERSGARR